MLSYVNSLVDRYVIGTSYVRVGFIRYADSASISFYLSSNYNKVTIKSQVLNAGYISGGSNLATALTTAVNSVFTSGTVRSGVSKVIVVVTDNLSSSSSSLTSAVSTVRSAGITIVGVGINYNNRVDQGVLASVVSDNRYTIVNDYTDLSSATSSYVTDVVSYTCVLLRTYSSFTMSILCYFLCIPTVTWFTWLSLFSVH